jgi:hypothetical protein
MTTGYAPTTPVRFGTLHDNWHAEYRRRLAALTFPREGDRADDLLLGHAWRGGDWVFVVHERQGFWIDTRSNTLAKHADVASWRLNEHTDRMKSLRESEQAEPQRADRCVAGMRPIDLPRLLFGDDVADGDWVECPECYMTAIIAKVGLTDQYTWQLRDHDVQGRLL